MVVPHCMDMFVWRMIIHSVFVASLELVLILRGERISKGFFGSKFLTLLVYISKYTLSIEIASSA